MLNLLDSSWGGAYFQSLIALFIFSLGIPALIVQIAIPIDIKRIILPNMIQYLIYFVILPIMVMTISCLLIIKYVSSHCTLLMTTHVVVWSFSAILIFVSITMLNYMHSNPLSLAIKLIHKRIKKEYNKMGKINEETANNLINLAANQDSGYKKQRVLDEIAKVISYMICLDTKNKSRYVNNALTPLLKGLDTIANFMKCKPNLENYTRMLDIAYIALNFLKTQNNIGQNDYASAKWIFVKLANSAAAEDFIDAIIPHIDSQTISSENLYKIGIQIPVIAIDQIAAVQCLRALESQVLDEEDFDEKSLRIINPNGKDLYDHKIDYLLGLVSWLAKNNEALKEKSLRTIQSRPDLFSRRSYIDAIKFFKKANHYQTASNIKELLILQSTMSNKINHFQAIMKLKVNKVVTKKS